MILITERELNMELQLKTDGQIQLYLNRCFQLVKNDLKEIHSTGILPREDYAEYVNNIFGGLDILTDCPKCKIPYLQMNSHIKSCNGAWERNKSHKLPLEDKVYYKKEQRLLPILSDAIELDDWYDYDKVCIDNGLVKKSSRLTWLKRLGLRERYLERFESMKSYRLYTETNCPKCDKEHKVLISTLERNQRMYCSAECYRKDSGFIQVKKNHGDRFKNYEEFEEWSKNVYDVWYHKVRNLSRKNLKKYKPDEYKRWKESKGVLHLDHIFPCGEGLKQDVPIELLAHTDNLRVIPAKDNQQKNNKVDISIVPQMIIESLSSDYIGSLSNYQEDS